MRNKTVAGLLAFIGGTVGLHRFYLGQVGLGILYIFFFWISWLIGIIDAIVFLSMDEDEFNARFNREHYDVIPRYERREERHERRRERYGQGRQPAAPPPRRERATAPPSENSFRKSGIKKFKDYDYEAAIEDFKKALEANPRDIATHFNLACAYSLMEKKEKSFYHLDRAVALGFNDFERIQSHDALAYLRVQPEFLTFADNNYRLAAEEKVTEKKAPPPEQQTKGQPQGDLLEQLNRLGELREKGLLTDDEFRAQKEKLLR